MTRSPALQRVVDQFAAIREAMSAPSDLGPVGQFRAICETIALGDDPIDGMVSAADGAPVPCEWICHASADPDVRLLLLHPGSFMAFAQRSNRRYASWVSRACGAAVLVPDYRLAPEHPFPAALEDSMAAYLWMRDNGPAGAAPARQVFMGGDSAGGTLTLAGMLWLRDKGLPLPDAAVAISSWTDLTLASPSYQTRAEADPLSSREAVEGSAQVYLAGADPADPYASPLLGDLGGLSPTLLMVGDAEVILDDSVRFAAKAQACGSDVEVEVWPQMIHCWPVFANVLPEGQAALDRMGAFLKAVGARRDALMAAEDRRVQALLAGRLEDLRVVLAPEAVHIHANGRVEALAPYLAGLASGARYLRMDRRTLDLRLHGRTATMLGAIDVEIERADGSRAALTAQITQTWVERDDGWKMTLFHACPASPA